MGQENRRDEAVKEYLRGGVTLREMETKYGISVSTIHRWAKRYEGVGESEAEGKEAGLGSGSGLPIKVRQLQKELEEARLYNRLLNAMIDIAEEEFEIPIRKKPGAKRR